MKIAFITTFGIKLLQEHFFTKEVFVALNKLYKGSDNSIICISFVSCAGSAETIVEDWHGYDNIIYKIPTHDKNDIPSLMAERIASLNVDVIHSNMIEGYDIVAARSLSIPIFNTIHIGGFVCPRGGGNGFLNHNDEICNSKVSMQCRKCMYADLPLPILGRTIDCITPKFIKNWFVKSINRPIFYLTPLFSIPGRIKERLDCIETFKGSNIITPNKLLLDKLSLNGISGNTILLPHGVVPRNRIPLPQIKGKIILGYLGRVQYSKGLHILLKALKGIDSDKYELHIIGDAAPNPKEQKYWKRIQHMAKGLNVVFHGRLLNNKIETVISDCHVMVQPSIYLEVYGISIAESLSLGRPVLAAKCGGAEMQIEDGRNGWLVDPNDIDALRDKIKYLICNPEEIVKCSKNAVTPHPIDEYVERLNELYMSSIK